MILTKTSGFIAEAGFSHSLTPARNCTFGCTYCYVPTMRIYGGLKPEDWRRWGQFTTFKPNAAESLARELRPEQRIYCSPLVDPYQPPEAEEQLMPRILDAVIARPPRVFCLQTRGILILRDLSQLRRIPDLRVSFSITTDRDDVRKLYEPHCASIADRLAAVRALREAGIEVYATLAPLLPCDAENLARMAIEASGRTLIGDPLHIREVKPRGATTREAAFKVAQAQGHEAWLDAAFQTEMIGRIDREARRAGLGFETGPRGFAKLAA
ncbi:MAG TPA: radical SAM protein [Bryobacteraceae bacterium]|nr:radical SAM protein [Bryobacteraceae bacterium]